MLVFLFFCIRHNARVDVSASKNSRRRHPNPHTESATPPWTHPSMRQRPGHRDFSALRTPIRTQIACLRAWMTTMMMM